MKNDYLIDPLFDAWQGMPEFIQEKQKPYAAIIVRVGSQKELDELSDKLGQPLTSKTTSAWYPFRPHRRSEIQPKWKSES
jgi:hypothetical protein